MPRISACRQRLTYTQIDQGASHPIRVTLNVEWAKQYQELYLYQVPIFLPYHPLEKKHERTNYGVPQLTFCIRLSEDVYDNLPANVKTDLAANGITRDKLVVYVTSQTMPWKGVGMLFRPHCAVHPNAPYRDNTLKYSETKSVYVGLYDTTGATLDGKKSTLVQESVSSHVDKASGLIVSSPDNMNLHNLDFQNSACLISLTIEPHVHGIVTMHWMLTDKQQNQLNNMFDTFPSTLEDCIDLFASYPEFCDYKAIPFATHLLAFTHGNTPYVKKKNTTAATTAAAATEAVERKESEEDMFRAAEEYANEVLVYEQSMSEGMRVEEERRIRDLAFEAFCQASPTGRAQLKNLMLAKWRHDPTPAAGAAAGAATAGTATARAATVARPDPMRQNDAATNEAALQYATAYAEKQASEYAEHENKAQRGAAAAAAAVSYVDTVREQAFNHALQLYVSASPERRRQLSNQFKEHNTVEAAGKPKTTEKTRAAAAASDRTTTKSLSQTIQGLRVDRANTYADLMASKGQNRNAAFFSHYNNPDHTMRMNTANLYADAAKQLGRNRDAAFWEYYSLKSPEACRPLEKAIETAQMKLDNPRSKP